MKKDNYEPRSVVLMRFGKVSEPMEDRMYKTSNPASKGADIETLTKTLKGKFDLVMLHDEIDECLLLNLEDGIASFFPCRLHHKEAIDNDRKN